MVRKGMHRIEAGILIAKSIYGSGFSYSADEGLGLVGIVNGRITGVAFLGSSRKKSQRPGRKEVIVKLYPPVKCIVLRKSSGDKQYPDLFLGTCIPYRRHKKGTANK
jgi:hypothetical protein